MSFYTHREIWWVHWSRRWTSRPLRRSPVGRPWTTTTPCSWSPGQWSRPEWSPEGEPHSRPGSSAGTAGRRPPSPPTHSSWDAKKRQKIKNLQKKMISSIAHPVAHRADVAQNVWRFLTNKSWAILWTIVQKFTHCFIRNILIWSLNI